MTHPQQTTREVLEQCVQALERARSFQEGGTGYAIRQEAHTRLLAIDTAITAGRAALALLSAPALPVPSDSDDLIKALADVRDLFPIPERGSKLEHAWLEAVAFPESVPAYVRACIAPAAMPVGELNPGTVVEIAKLHGTRYVNRHYSEKANYGFVSEGLIAFANAILASAHSQP